MTRRKNSGGLTRNQAAMLRAWHSKRTDPHTWDEVDTRLRGDGINQGVFDLLDATSGVLLGKTLPGFSSDAIQPGRERLFASMASMLIWRQDWSVIVY